MIGGEFDGMLLSSLTHSLVKTRRCKIYDKASLVLGQHQRLSYCHRSSSHDDRVGSQKVLTNFFFDLFNDNALLHNQPRRMIFPPLSF